MNEFGHRDGDMAHRQMQNRDREIQSQRQINREIEDTQIEGDRKTEIYLEINRDK